MIAFLARRLGNAHLLQYQASEAMRHKHERPEPSSLFEWSAATTTQLISVRITTHLRLLTSQAQKFVEQPLCIPTQRVGIAMHDEGHSPFSHRESCARGHPNCQRPSHRRISIAA
jgi:hypothetical protein